MISKLPINRNTDEWDLSKEIADSVLSAIESIEQGEAVRTVEFVTNKNRGLERIVSDAKKSD